MIETGRIYILGSGAIGLPLAAYLASDGRSVVAVRTSRNDVSKDTIAISVHNSADDLRVSVETVSKPRNSPGCRFSTAENRSS